LIRFIDKLKKMDAATHPFFVDVIRFDAFRGQRYKRSDRSFPEETKVLIRNVFRAFID